MTLKDILEIYPENDWLKADGFDDCVIGIVHSFSGEAILAYDYHKIIKKLRKNMSEEEAIKYLETLLTAQASGMKIPSSFPKEKDLAIAEDSTK